MANTSQSTKTKDPKRRSLGVWFVRNAALLTVALVGISKVPGLNGGYQWMWEGYVKQNLEFVKQYPDATYDQKMSMKLGADYNYLVWLRDNTPADAVIYLPTRGDFQSPGPNGEQSPFRGSLIDKLCAVRVLYPRRVVTVDEYGKTSWSDKLTHIAIVNGKNTDKLHYPAPADYPIGVLPVELPKQPQQ